VLDYKDGSGLQFVEFDFVTGFPEIKLAISLEVRAFERLYFLSSLHCLPFITVGDFFLSILRQ